MRKKKCNFGLAVKVAKKNLTFLYNSTSNLISTIIYANETNHMTNFINKTLFAYIKVKYLMNF